MWAEDFSDLGRLLEKCLLGELMSDENILPTRLPEVLKPFEELLLDLRKEKVSSSEEFLDRIPSLTEEMTNLHFRDSDIGSYEIRSITSGLLVSEPELKIGARRSRRKKRQRITWASFIASLVLITSPSCLKSMRKMTAYITNFYRAINVPTRLSIVSNSRVPYLEPRQDLYI